MNNIQVFQNAQFGQIRTVVTENGEPLFCLADVCAALQLTNNRKVKSQLDEDVTLSYPLQTPGGVQQATFVTEPGMYTVILRSDSPKAKPMQKWVTSEVLPALRKTGGYMVARTDETPEQIMARALIVAQETIKRTETEKARLIEQNELSKRELQAAAPKVQYYNEVLTSESTYLATQIAKELGMGAPTLNEKLRKLGVQYKQNGQWILTYKYQNKGYTKTQTYKFTHSDGRPGTNMQTEWTEKGRQFIHSLLSD